MLLALACLCAAGGTAAAQNRDSIVQQPPLTNVPGVPPTQQPPTQQLPPRQTPGEQPPADTPAARQPSRPRPSIPNVQLPSIRIPGVRPRGIAVPPLSGRTLAEARRILTGAGLTLGEVSELPVDRPAGTIFLQRPAAGTQAQRGSPVSVTLARAPAPAPPPARSATVPDVTGQALSTAVRTLEGAGLRVASVDGASGSTARVSAQSYRAGETVPLGTAVRLTMSAPAAPVVATRPPVQPPARQPANPPAQQPVAQAPRQAPPVDSAAVPELGALALIDARAALQSAGLAAGVDPALADSASWTVASQVPAAGARIPLGGIVALSLAPPPAPLVGEQPAVPPPAASPVQTPRPAERTSAPPVEARRRTLPWPWMLLAIVVLAAAAGARRRMRARGGTAAVAPVAVSTRVRAEAPARVEVQGRPFTAAAPRLRMRAREATPELSVAAAGPLFTTTGGAGD
ncbi:MAG TPA: PASTA domain-containing protein [Longimicrobium sp.]|nr:PASTA domain-containing protein [Longimicrobium sp.]